MRVPARIMSLVLAFIFAIPDNFPTSAQQIEFIPSAHAAATQEECAKKPGYVWQVVSGSARCVQDPQGVKAATEAAACAKYTDPKEQQKCYRENATRSSKEADGIKDTFQASTGGTSWVDPSTPALISTVLTSFYLLRRKVNSEKKPATDCQTTSIWLLFGAGMVSIVGEITANVYYRNKMRDIVKGYRDKTRTESEVSEDGRTTKSKLTEEDYQNAAEDQKAAFNYLIEQEEARKKAATIKSIAYGTAGGLYTGALVATIWETVQESTALTSVNVKCQYSSDELSKNAMLNSAWGALGLAAGGTGKIIKGVKDDAGYEPIEELNRSEEVKKPDFIRQQNMSLPEHYYAQIRNEHPLYNIMNYEVNAQTKELRDISGFKFDYLSATENEHMEMLRRFMNFFIPEAMAQNNDARELDRTGQILNKDGSVKRDMNMGVDILLEAAMLIINVLTIGGAVMSINAILTATGKGDYVLDNALSTPLGRGVISGLMATWSFVVMGYSIAAVSNAGDRIDAIKEIRDKFSGVRPNLDNCPNRDDPANPVCYCYTKEGKNTARAASNICAAVWGEGGLPPATNWGLLANASMVGGGRCVTSDNKLHVGGKCPCRRSTGKSNDKSQCAGIKFGGAVPNAGAMKLFNGMTNDVNSDMAGTLAGSDIAAGATRTNNMIKALDKMKKDKKLAPIIAKMEKNKGKLEEQFKTLSASIAPRGISHAAMMGGSPANVSAISSPEELKKAVKEAIKSDLEFEKRGSSGATQSKDSDAFNFDFASGPGTTEELAGVMENEYKIDDVSSNPDANIFDILSMRYKTSGMKRLFGEE